MKTLCDENAAKFVGLQKELLVVEDKFAQLQEQNSKVLDLEQMETERKTWEGERERLQKEKSELEKRIEQLTLTNHVNYFRYLKIAFIRTHIF